LLLSNDIIKELLIELAVKPANIHPPKGHSLTKSQRKKLEELVMPYYAILTEYKEIIIHP
jgi:hypothetical protein